ncbi:ComF family protein [Streptomyces ferrugineus]|uniref:ComF family protein n=1 Tax=Streptomyces ferrugineus TaxID=1413221 RepID=A0A7M2SNM7_9ACTN|nr:ComF family protein [Streptomyces ferrugineus]QOV37957.1 ComF family protein [Streptomyces ferrugineus]
MRGWWQDLTDLVLPAECGGCGRPRTVLCPECRAVLSGTVPSRVRPVPEPPGLPVVHAAARYADEARAVLLAHKERGALALAAPLGAALAGAVTAALPRGSHGRARGAERFGDAGAPVLLVPVPSARGAVRARGHDPARRIALAAAGELRRAGMPARMLAVLRQGRAVADQSGLDSRQRLDNLAGALKVVPGGGRLLAGGGPVVLVDDLMTTGASLAEAARAVRAALTEHAGPGGTGWSGAGRDLVGSAGVYGRTVGEADAYGWGTAERGAGGGGATAVYARGSRESTGERVAGSLEGAVRRTRERPGIMGAGGPHDLICAAVVAASPDSFEINRN